MVRSTLEVFAFSLEFIPHANDSLFPLVGAPWVPGWTLAQVPQAMAQPPVPWAWGLEPHCPWGEEEGEGGRARTPWPVGTGHQTQGPHDLRRGRGRVKGTNCQVATGLLERKRPTPGSCPLRPVF